MKRLLASACPKGSLVDAKSAIFAGVVLAIWLAVVIFTATRHEFWRDEVRALSFVRTATSLPDLFHLIRNDGHPVVWYFLLYVGKSIVDTPLVLPVISITVAFAAVAVFMLFSPFPFWLRCLFIFGAIPLYEYSVMARNYGISMLFLFSAAALYRNRSKHPVRLAFVLALLANTNLHSIILVCLITGLWIWDTITEKRARSFPSQGTSLALPLGIVLSGVLLSMAFAVPREDTIVTSAHHSTNAAKIVSSFLDAVLQPHEAFAEIVPSTFPSWLSTALLYLVALGLLHRPGLFLAALGGQVALGMLFRVIYAGLYRHQGLFLIFVLFLYWLFIDALHKGSLPRIRRRLFNVGLYAGVVILLVWNVVVALIIVPTDINQERSSGKAFGEYLKDTEDYRDAIIVPEPDFLLESLPYYAPNTLYLIREHRFSTTVSFTTRADYRLSLGELLRTAHDIKTHYGRPVLIVLGDYDVGPYTVGVKSYSYNRIFSWNSHELEDFRASTQFVTEFNSAYTDENYLVYALK